MNRVAIQFRRRRRHGMIFIMAIGIIAILSGLVLVFAQNMRTETQASANRLAYQQADGVELGAEQWVLAQVDTNTTDAYTITQNTPAGGIKVGNGYFWVLQFDPNADDDDPPLFGITDESGKLSLNSATAAELQLLPNTITQAMADAVLDSRNPASQQTSDGAESIYYNGLQPEPYNCKNLPFETVEELLLVRDFTPQILFGYDLNRNGVIDPEEEAAGNSQGLQLNNTTTNDSRGIFNYLTVYTTRPATAAAGGGGGAARPPTRGRGGGGGGAATPTVGVINVLTASQQVLMCLPGMTQTAASQIITSRSSNSTATNTQWVSSIVGADIYSQISPLITTTSYQYSADIVAVSGDGRSYKRVLIVVDCQKAPAKIIYRKDLTSLGWPMSQELRDALRSGKDWPQGYSSDVLGAAGNTGIGMPGGALK